MGPRSRLTCEKHRMPLVGFQWVSKQAKCFEFWGGRRESNPQRPEPQSGALPVELLPPYLLIITTGRTTVRKGGRSHLAWPLALCWWKVWRQVVTPALHVESPHSRNPAPLPTSSLGEPAAKHGRLSFQSCWAGAASGLGENDGMGNSESRRRTPGSSLG